MDKTKEPQYQVQIDVAQEKGLISLGLTTSHLWRTDPRHLVFLLARYKFCAKLLAGKERVLEVGCGDGFGTSMVQQNVPLVHGVDFDPLFIENAKKINRERPQISFAVVDVVAEPLMGIYDAVYSLDVLEHISPEREGYYMKNLVSVLSSSGICIIGTPNQTASVHASVWSQEGHINLKSEPTLRSLLERYFENVFIFSMNDEVVHTGYYPMAHYLMALAVGPRSS